MSTWEDGKQVVGDGFCHTAGYKFKQIAYESAMKTALTYSPQWKENQWAGAKSIE